MDSVHITQGKHMLRMYLHVYGGQPLGIHHWGWGENVPTCLQRTATGCTPLGVGGETGLQSMQLASYCACVEDRLNGYFHTNDNL